MVGALACFTDGQADRQIEIKEELILLVALEEKKLGCVLRRSMS